jgi:prevent-host-death family protein
MKTVQIREAKAKFSALVDAASRGQPTTITRHGVPVAVLTPIEAARRIYPQAQESFADLLLSFPGGVEFERDQTPMRGIDL